MPDDNNLIGQQVGQFTILEEVGRGGMATVYRATQQSINRQVAIKVLPRAFLHDPGFYERFVREVEVVSGLEHPHIVPIYDFGEHEGMPYIAMRYLAGGNLRKLIDEDSQLRDLVRPISQIAQALDHAHTNGIIHRDLKPGNILLDEHDNAYLSDFGIAKVVNSDLTGSSIIGTPTYMSPEQANGEDIDGRADVYSLGIVIFELITGREPFVADTPIAMIMKHMTERVPYLSEFRENVPRAVDAVIAKATEKQPDKRYASAGELAEAFDNAVRGAIEHLPLPSTGPLPEYAETETLPPRKAPPPPRKRRTEHLDGETIATDEVSHADVLQRAASSANVSDEERMMTWLWRFAAVALAILAGAYALLREPAAPQLDITPPYAGARIVQTDSYAVAVPPSWGPEAGYTDASDVTRPLLHTWQAPDETARVALAVLTPPTSQSADDAIADYLAQTYTEADYTPIDSAQSGDVTRASYRTAGGQTDVFVRVLDDGRLVTLAAFTSDEVTDETRAQIQTMLDTLELFA